MAIAAERAPRNIMVLGRGFYGAHRLGGKAYDLAAVADRVPGGLDPADRRVPGPSRSCCSQHSRWLTVPPVTALDGVARLPFIRRENAVYLASPIRSHSSRYGDLAQMCAQFRCQPRFRLLD